MGEDIGASEGEILKKSSKVKRSPERQVEGGLEEILREVKDGFREIKNEIREMRESREGNGWRK